METIALTVNGRASTLTVEPRTSVADALREQLNLTGTHLGCEQGVCGACTVLIDGKPQRSCIAFAVDCADGTVTTIEGFDSDETMAALRAAFSAHHGLQCGFCTPGMLITARDIVLRLGDVPETRIRQELAGNLCRCTGYVGIVNAIRSVASGRTPTIEAPVLPTQSIVIMSSVGQAVATQSQPHPANIHVGGPVIEQRIPIAASPDAVWAALSDLRAVARCLPGAELDSVDGNALTGHVQIALGPVRARFAGTGTIALDDAKREGRIQGTGRDTGGSATTGDITWTIEPSDSGTTILAVRIAWRLTGPLAQFSRGGLAQDLVRRLTADFVSNLEAMIAGRTPPPAKPIGLFALLWSILKRRLLGRRGEHATPRS